MNRLKSKLANALEYVHPKYFASLARGDSSAQRKSVREKLRPQPASRAAKEHAVRSYAARGNCRIMVETGTFRGDLIFALLRDFDHLFSIEMQHELFLAAELRFAAEKTVTIIEGDSAGALPLILAKLHTPAVFWLDAHASGDETARGAMETPIVSELSAILNHSVKSHVILIDDAREFGMGRHYPTLKRVQKMVAGTYKEFEVKDDIIRITC
ncbi:MAG TPA: hypothetical protein VFC07_01065 [Verrucomicrobiae bacterium]|nr:hypothetical protein [Verrucomicrobiae bacterium]